MDAVLDSRSASIDEDDTEHDDARIEDISSTGGSSSSDRRLPDRYGNNNDSYYDSEAEDDAPYLNYDSDNDNGSLQSCSSTEERCAMNSNSGCHPSSFFVEESTTNMLQANNPDYSRLELDETIDDISCLCEAIRNNKTIRDVEVHIEALEGLSRADQRQLADAICSLAELRSLLVYKNSALYIDPLQRHGSFLLENLQLRKLDVFSEPTSVYKLATALKGLPSLRSLDVGFDSTDSDEVLDALVHLKSVYVELQCFRIDYKAQEVDDDADTNDGSTPNTTSNDMLDDRIVMAIAEAVEQSKTLKTLALPPYSCSERCYETLIHMLKHNVTLERIDYWVRVCNLYYPDANETIDHLLHLNQTGARRLVRQKHISSLEVLQLMIDANKDDVHTAYHLFSSHPSLLLLACA